MRISRVALQLVTNSNMILSSSCSNSDQHEMQHVIKRDLLNFLAIILMIKEDPRLRLEKVKHYQLQIHEIQNNLLSQLVAVFICRCIKHNTKRKGRKYLPGANAIQVLEKNSLRSRRIYVNRAAVPPPRECPTIFKGKKLQ